MRTRLPLLLVALLAACTTAHPVARATSPSLSPTPGITTAAPRPVASTTRPTRSPAAEPTSTPSVARQVALPSCPTYRGADPKRPVLTAEVTVNGASVVGTEHLVFTPDLDISQLVFRLWASSPRPTAAGGSSALTSVKVNGATTAFTRPAKTLIRIPFAAKASTAITIDLGFTITLPTGADDRYGHRGTTSWFASGIPLLAWEPGRGWATEPATGQFAEASTSTEMTLARLTVHHAAGLTALATGAAVSRTATTLVTSAPTVRDVAVAVAAFKLASVAGPVPLTVGVVPGMKDVASTIAREAEALAQQHISRFGPFPYEHLVIAVLPDINGGIEYPGAILLGTGQDKDATLSHELGHEWFYGLVGDDQARDPWLDEAFATYAEAVDRGTTSDYTGRTLPADVRGFTGRPMTFWEHRKHYYLGVYVQGAAALLRARATNPRLFDAQMRCYVAHNAHRIATPADVAKDLPLAVTLLRRAGALP